MQNLASDQTGNVVPRIFDIAIVGGGINGTAIARDAAGRGWSVFLAEKDDLASATSSASTKLIHGGLRYLEYYEFRLVREALMERERLWAIAPHIIRPLRFVLPHHAGLRPAWVLRLGLFLYDHLGGRKRLPPTKTLKLLSDPAGRPLKPEFRLGFEYSDCWVEDARLVVLNAMDAARRGAVIAPRTAVVAGRRDDGLWVVSLQEQRTGQTHDIRARSLVNAAGPWVADVLGSALGQNATPAVRLVKGSHIVVKKLYDHDRCYIFQNRDGRILFAIPYEADFTLIGTTDLDFRGDPRGVGASEDEISYLCAAASDYFAAPIMPDQVVWSYAGVRPLYDDGASEARAATRDYVLNLDVAADRAALLSVYGGKITTARRLAEAALARLKPHLPVPTAKVAEAGWTAAAALPGGDFPLDGVESLVISLRTHQPFLPEPLARRLVRTYGTRATEILGSATETADLGRCFGADLYEAEVRYLTRAEWAMTATDIVWRRTKLGLRLTPDEIAALAAFLEAKSEADLHGKVEPVRASITPDRAVGR